MKTKTLQTASIRLALVASSLAAAAQTPPTLKVLYTFERVGGTPAAITEVSPDSFLGVMETSPGLFFIAGDGTWLPVAHNSKTGRSASSTFPGVRRSSSRAPVTTLRGLSRIAFSRLAPVWLRAKAFFAGAGRCTAAFGRLS